MQARKVVIKKYENRRLYDTENSRYVNMDDIAAMVREGVDVQVLDAVTGEDLTRTVLTQIIADSAKGPNSAFPLDILREMIVASGKAGQDGLLYMRSLFDTYQSAYRNLAPPAANPYDFLQRLMTAAAKPGGAGEGGASEVEELRRRIEELEKRASKPAPKKRGPRRR